MSALEDPDVTELNVNPDGTVWVERFGCAMIQIGDIAAHRVESVLTTVASMLETKIGRDAPILEGEFPIGGMRLIGILPPVVTRASVSLRRPAARIFTLDEYVDGKILRHDDAEVIRQAIRRRSNILVVGGTGSGKTTLVNALLHEIATATPDDRVAVIEDTRELRIASRNAIFLRTTLEADVTRLLRAAMRLHPKRIVVGEVRGPEADGLLLAWNSGHPGGVCTIHANSGEDGLHKLVRYVAQSPNSRTLAATAIAAELPRLIDLVVFIEACVEPPFRRVTECCQLRAFADGAFQLGDR
jgi:type IV secretion system protein VirB11